MIPVTIQKTIQIAASAALVWQYVGTEAGLRQWWGLEIALEEKLGGRCEERSMVEQKVHCLQGEVTAYAPPHQLALLLRNTDEQVNWPAWMTISITLQERAGRTQVTLIHQTFGFVVGETAIGVAHALPSTARGPQARWTGQPAQNVGSGVPIPEFYPVFPPTPIAAQAWLTRYDSVWHERLHALAQQVLLNSIEW